MTKYIIALLKVKGIGPNKVLSFFIDNHFDIEKIKNNIRTFIGNENYSMFNKLLDDAESELKRNLDLGINCISLFEKDFPSKLYTNRDPVLYLYYKGNISLLSKESIAIIGTRTPSDIGEQDAKLITNKLSESYVIVSGLALGIDSIAHQVCLDNKGKTIAVLPSGLDNIQPTSNKKLANDILNNGGCLISEYSSGTLFNKFTYAKRDRIQTYLSNLIVVPEANDKSGTMIAVEKANKEGVTVLKSQNCSNSKINKSVDANNIDIKLINEEIKKNLKLNTIKFNKLCIIDEKFEQIGLF